MLVVIYNYFPETRGKSLEEVRIFLTSATGAAAERFFPQIAELFDGPQELFETIEKEDKIEKLGSQKMELEYAS